MTALVRRSFSLRRAVSGQFLFFIALGLSLSLTAAFCLSILLAAQRDNRQLVENVEAQMLLILQENGVSGLAATFENARRIVLPGTDRLELALWRVRGRNRSLILETMPGVADAFQEGGTQAELSDVTFALREVDVLSASQDWALPMQDVTLIFGFEQPTFEMQRALRSIAIILTASLFLCGLMIFLQVVHWQRYRRSLRRINRLLDRYANGETGIGFKDEDPVPELRELGRQLNIVLPKIDRLFADLRALSAHLAHELRTPLQNIRIGVRNILRAQEPSDKEEFARRVDREINGADARLRTIMQLFRLQADAEVTISRDIALGDLVEDLVYDFEADLVEGDRTLKMDISKSVLVAGNVHLIELLISNLLSNAAKYASEGSRIDVSLTTSEEGFRLEVSNAGVLSAELPQNAFERYAQGTEHRSMTGYGLGLALVQAIAEKHGFEASISQKTSDDGSARVAAIVEGPLQEAADD